MGFEDTFKALSDPVRRKILTNLKGGRMFAGEIGQAFQMTGATISYHLAQLKKARLVTMTRYKNFVYYELNAPVFEDALIWLKQFGGKNEEK